MRHLPILALLLGLVACDPDTPPPAGGDVPPAVDTSTMVILKPITLEGLRYDGVYMMVDGALHYYVRFFQRGNVALVAGPEKEADFDSIPSIRTYLTQNVQSGWNNVHNTPVEQRNDSLFFRTMGTRGAITYACTVRNDSLVMIKESEIKRAKLVYTFAPDRP